MTFVTFLLHSFIHPVSQRASQPASYSFWLHRFFWSLPLGYHLLLNNRGFLIVHISGSGERMNNNNNKCRHNLPRRRNRRHQGNQHPGKMLNIFIEFQVNPPFSGDRNNYRKHAQNEILSPPLNCFGVCFFLYPTPWL